MIPVTKLDQLTNLFPQLSQENQQYVLGVTEGLAHAQKSPGISSRVRAGSPLEKGQEERRPLLRRRERSYGW
jgi:hypothetical protein